MRLFVNRKTSDIGWISEHCWVPSDIKVSFRGTMMSMSVCCGRIWKKILLEIRTHFGALGFDVRECETSKGHYQVRINKENNLVGLDVFPVKPFCGKRDKKAISARVHEAQNELMKRVAAANTKDINDIRNKIKEIENDFISNTSGKNATMYFYGIDFPHEHGTVAFDREELLPLKKMEFEGRLYNCPFNSDGHLKDLYGDYMTFPVHTSDDLSLS